MSRQNPFALVVVGAAAAAGALAASPGTYAWLRRTLRLETDRTHYEDAAEVDAVATPPEADSSLAEARLTLRARLQESGAIAAEPAPPESVPDAHAAARARLRAKADEAIASLRGEAPGGGAPDDARSGDGRSKDDRDREDDERTDEIEPVS